MNNEVCVRCLEDIKILFVRGSENCKDEALEIHNQYISALDYAIKFLKMDEDAKQASIPYTYDAPQHDWKCGYSTAKHSWVYNKIKETDDDN